MALLVLDVDVVKKVLELASHEHYCGQEYEEGNGEQHSPLYSKEIIDCEDCRDMIALRDGLVRAGHGNDKWVKENTFIEDEEDGGE